MIISIKEQIKERIEKIDTAIRKYFEIDDLFEHSYDKIVFTEEEASDEYYIYTAVNILNDNAELCYAIGQQEKIEQMIIEGIEDGFYPKAATDYEYFIAHEIMHLIEWRIILHYFPEMRFSYFDEAFLSRKILNKMKNKYSEKRIIEELGKHILEDEEIEPKEFTAAIVGAYFNTRLLPNGFLNDGISLIGAAIQDIRGNFDGNLTTMA